MDNEYTLKIKNLEVRYHSNNMTAYAVNGIDLEIKPGEEVGLVGESGAGKTTTALSIIKLLPNIGRNSVYSADELSFGNIDLYNASEVEMQAIRGTMISMIFQDPMTSLNPLMRINLQIAEAIKVHNPDLSDGQIEEKVEHLLNLVGIPANRKTSFPHELSGGMKQRVLIAMALSCKPKLIIADEPTTALDVTIQKQVLNLINDLKDALGTSVLLITHDLGIVAENCDRVNVMYAGEIVESGTTEEIFSDGLHHPYTEGLFNSIPVMDADSDRLIPIKGATPSPYELPKGCKFAPRCPYCQEKCLKENPAITSLSDDHNIKCHYPINYIVNK